MEDPKLLTCRICLGSLDVHRNLYDENYKTLLQLLNRILGFEVQIKGGIFTICQSCEGKLNWVLEFKNLCEKALEKIKNTDCKEEFINIDDYSLCLETNEFNYERDNSGSDSDFNISEPKKRKKDRKTSPKITNGTKAAKSAGNAKWKRCRSMQYPPNEVLHAIAESTTYFTDIKNRTCIHCDYLATTAKMLSIHMHNKHWDFLKTWCNRCNIQTENVDNHRNTVKCCEDRCKFCNKKCGKINRLTEHLRTHCHEIFKKPDDNVDFEWDSNLLAQFQIDNTANADVATSQDNPNSKPWLKEDPLLNNVKNSTKNENDSNEKENLHRYRKHSSSPQNSEDENGPTPKRVRKSRLEQFPHVEVEKAIKESMRSFHTNRQCIICGKITKNSKFLSGHMTKLHRNKRENWCSRCNTLADNLQEHKLSHRNDLLKCNFCERGFNTIVHFKEHLKGHSRSYGLKIESNWFSCKFCPESFPNDKEFREHRCKSNRGRLRTTRKTRSKKSIIESSDDEDDDNDVSSNAGEGSGRSRLKQYSPEEVQQAINNSMKSFHENRKCILCGFLASHSRTLSFHMSKVHKNMFHRWCSRCNTAVDNLPDHKEGHKNDILKCKFCGKGFSKIVHLKDHLKCHSRSYTLDTLPKFYNCKACPNTYPSEKELKEHDCQGPGPQTLAEKKFIRPAVCIICKMRVKNLRIHVKHKHKPKNGPIKKLCSVCGKTCSTNYDLAMHMRTHTGELPHKCTYCDKRFSVRTSLLVHEKRHLGEKPHVCHICGKAFVTPGDLRRHVEIHEGGPEQCPICDKQFCRPGVLKLHMKRHTGENPFSCIDCGLSFHRRSLLLLHIKKHSNERPFKCSFCEKDFKHRQELKDHERIHKGIKPYKCSQCSYTCGKSYSLTLHMKQHPEDSPQANRPHKCLFCYKQFSTNAMLMSHTNNKHRESTTM